MRFAGKLTTWHADRGFGFITPDEGGQDVFVHVSQLPRGIQPAVGQALVFEVALNPQGKKKAVGVFVKAGEQPAVRREVAAVGTHRLARPAAGLRSLYRVVLVLVIGALAFSGYRAFTRHMQELERPGTAGLPTRRSQPVLVESASPPAQTAYRCDGRTMCSQMTSCAEATWVLKHCPGTKMDGNHDGVPCEQQWCTGGAR